MVPMQDVRWAVRLAVVAGTMLSSILLLGSQHGHAAPLAPVTPTGLAQPTLATSPKPPTPKPTIDVPATDIVIEPPCWQLDTCQPPTEKPDEPPTSDSKPSIDPKASPGPTRTTEPAGQPRPAPPVIPTPTRINADGAAASAEPTWLFWVLPGLALLTLAAGLAGWRLARSEQVRP